MTSNVIDDADMRQSLIHELSQLFDALEHDLRLFALDHGAPGITSYGDRVFWLAGQHEELAYVLIEPGSTISWARDMLSSADVPTLAALAEATNPTDGFPEDAISHLQQPMPAWLRDAIVDFSDLNPAPGAVDDRPGTGLAVQWIGRDSYR